MTSRLSNKRVMLSARAADNSTEIFVSDGRFRKLASGLGHLQIEVEPGIYKVRFRAGDVQHDSLIEVMPDDLEKTVTGPRVAFRSAAPIEATQTSREHHLAAAQAGAISAPLVRGAGSHLFILARELDESSQTDPWTGVSVHDINGDLVAKMSDGECNGPLRYGSLHLEVDPGTYRLRIDTSPLGVYESFLVTAAGWQTQVFTLADEFWGGDTRLRRPALRDAAILMVRAGAGFDSKSDQVRLADLARKGLASRRVVDG